jgi:hypothetical protein
VQFRPVIDLIQKFRLSESTVDSNYSINSVDVIINGGNAGVPSIPQFGAPPMYPQQPGQFVWIPQDSYVKPSGGNGGYGARNSRAFKFSRNGNFRESTNDRFQPSRGVRFDQRRSFEKKDVSSSRGDQTSRGDIDQSRKDRYPRGDTKTTASSGGGNKKRDRPSSSNDLQAASMTVATGDDDDDDEAEEDEENFSSDEQSK